MTNLKTAIDVNKVGGYYSRFPKNFDENQFQVSCLRANRQKKELSVFNDFFNNEKSEEVTGEKSILLK